MAAEDDLSSASVFRAWLGDPATVGADSWLQVIYIVAAALAAVVAILQLRKNVLQSRASFLLQLDRQWDQLKPQRKSFTDIRLKIRARILPNFADKEDSVRDTELRKAYKAHFDKMFKENIDDFADLCEYLSFFETIGLMVRKGYLPFKDVYLLYKGPILEIERGFTDFIIEWQKDAHMPSGLYENLLMVTRRTKRASEMRARFKALKFWEKP